MSSVPSGIPSSSSLKTWERRLNDAKKKHRPKLSNWSRDNFADRTTDKGSRFEKLCIHDNLQSQVIEVTTPSIPDATNKSTRHIDRIHCKNMSYTQFVNSYEIANKPVIISGIPENEQWDAVNAWKFKASSSSSSSSSSACSNITTTTTTATTDSDTIIKTTKNAYFKVGEDDDGYKVKVRMKYFIKYMKNNKDDSPLYIFDSNYDTNPISKCILSQYKVPSYFPDDLFEIVGEKKRPPYRWFLLGPKRSGTTIHIDPLATSAWNTLLKGRKRWILFPPGIEKKIVKGTDCIKKGEDDESINYFVDIIPRIKERYCNNNTISNGKEIYTIEFTQMPGDTVFIPGGWWHCVLNLDDTIAITQNFCSRNNFDKVWRQTRSGRKKMAVKWLRKMKLSSFSFLADRAIQMNSDDDFTMYNSDHKRKREDDQIDKNNGINKIMKLIGDIIQPVSSGI